MSKQKQHLSLHDDCECIFCSVKRIADSFIYHLSSRISAHRFFFFIIVTQFFFTLSAKGQDSSNVLPKFSVKHFGEEEGLPQNSINCILSDTNDFLWIATEAGVCRFNGRRFIPVKQATYPAQANFTRVKALYKKGTDTILAYSNNSQKVAVIIKNKIVSIEDQHAENQGMLFYNRPFPVPAPPYVRGHNGSLTHASGMEKWNLELMNYVGDTYNKDTFSVVLKKGIGIYSSTGLIGANNINDIRPERVIFSNHQIIYFDKKNYANYYSPDGMLQKTKPLDVGTTSALLFYNNHLGNFFYCIADSILYRIDIDSVGNMKIVKLISGLQQSRDISTLYEKDRNTIVVGTYGHGLFVYKRICFSFSELLPNGMSNCFYTQQLLSDSQTIFTGRGQFFKHDQYVGNITDRMRRDMYSTLKDRKGNYWYVADSCVFYCRGMISSMKKKAVCVDGRYCFVLLEDKAGRIWIASSMGLGYFDHDQFTRVEIKGVPLNIITRMRQDSLGKYYIGTHSGLYIWDNINAREAKEIPALKGYDIMFLSVQNSGMIWVSTYGNGIFLINNGSLTSFPQNNGKLAYVHSMIEDKSGNVWMPTINGLFVTTKSSLIEYAENKKDLPFFYEFSTNDGLRTNEFVGGGEPSFLLLPTDEISLTTMQGLVRFPSTKMNFEFSKSPILIDNIKFDSFSIDSMDGFDVGTDINNICFSVSTAYWGTKENEKIEYSLNEKKSTTNAVWLTVDETGKINLFSPSNGHYQLSIRKRTGLGPNDFVYKNIGFHVLPKWYETNSFFIALAAFIILIMYGILLLRKNYYRKATEVLQQKVNAATFELQQMNSTLERKVEERTLEIQRSEIKSRTLIERSSVGVYIIQDDKFIFVNPKFEELTGYRNEEAIGMNPLLLFDEPEQIIVKEKIRQRMSGEVESDHYEIAGRKKDGSVCQWELMCSRTIYDGKPTLLGTMLDITERAKIQHELEEAERKFRDLVEKSLVGVYISQGEKFVYVNPRFAEMYGYEPEELLDMPSFNTLVHKDDWETTRKTVQERMAGKMNEARYEFRGLKKDGGIIYAEVFGRVTQFGGLPAIIGTVIDVTEKKIAEQQLIKEKNLSQSIINNLPGIFYIFNQELNYLLWNKNLETVSGYSKEEISKIKLSQFTLEEEFPKIGKEIGKIFTDGYADIEASLVCKDGTTIPYYFNGITINYNDKICVLGVGIDISERKKAQEERERAIDAMQKSEANLNTIFLHTDTVYILLDTNLRIIAFNQRAADYMKKVYKKTLMISQSFIDMIRENGRQSFRESAKKVMSGNAQSYEKSHLQPDGKYTWYHVRKFPVLHASKNPLGMMIVISDITEKKLLEQEIMEQKIQEQKKIIRAILVGEEKERNKIGQELHDNINQILAGTRLYLGIVDQDKSINEEIIKRSMTLLDSAIDEIRHLSKYKVTPTKKTNLREMLQTLITNFHETTNVQIDFIYTGKIGSATDDLKLNIYRIIQEQLNNITKHANAHNVILSVNTGEKNIRLQVSDDGKGFDTNVRTSGIGIDNMTNRVESFNGTISIMSSIGEGCSIEVNLPL